MQTERKRAMQTVLRATEQERVRLAADLHDGPVQELTALPLRRSPGPATGIQRKASPAQADGLLGELEDELAAGITGAAPGSWPSYGRPVLDEQGLDGRPSSNTGPSLRGEPDRRRPAPSRPACRAGSASELETVLYRVTQETLNNVGKHAGASRVTVSAGRRERLGAPADQRRRGRLRPGRWPAASSARATSAWPACASGSRWSAATSASTQPPVRARPSTSRWPATRSASSPANPPARGRSGRAVDNPAHPCT